jgi:type IV pilus assembly protein PilX
VEAAVVIIGKRHLFQRGQKGVALPIALIMLVAMIVAAVALFRAVDTAILVAGNLTFKQGTVHAGDQGIKAAHTWLQGQATSSPASLLNSSTAQGYYSSQHVNDPDWNPLIDWPTSGNVTVGTDAGGNTISYVIHRLCAQPGLAYNATDQLCATHTAVSTASSGGSQSVDAPAFSGIVYVYYRVTVKVAGPRNSLSFIQALLLAPVS